MSDWKRRVREKYLLLSVLRLEPRRAGPAVASPGSVMNSMQMEDQ